MGKRAYRMVARAEATASTRNAIMDAAAQIFVEGSYGDFTLDAVARRAGVTLQTVLRHFGSKDGLIDAAIDHKTAEVFATREPASAGDAAAAIGKLAASYEHMGEKNWRLLCHEERHEAVHRVLATARRRHREWLAHNFAEVLPARGA